MTLGTGIFLSSLALCLVALFISTKDRWNWKKILLWTFASLLMAAFIGGIGVYTYSYLSKKPHIENSFWGIALSATKADIKFLKGEPTKIEEEDWIYDVREEAYRISFRGDKIRYIAFLGPNRSIFTPDLQGITLNDPSEKVREIYGEPKHVMVSSDQLMRAYNYNDYQTFFIFERNTVQSYGIFNPEFGPLKLK